MAVYPDCSCSFERPFRRRRPRAVFTDAVLQDGKKGKKTLAAQLKSSCTRGVAMSLRSPCLLSSDLMPALNLHGT